MSGKLIVFEGVEGSGKTTQLQRVHQWLSAHTGLFSRPVIATRQPGGTALGTELRGLLLGYKGVDVVHSNTELLLYAADRAQHVEGFLKPALAKGAIILCDRYTDSTVAYQGYGRQLDLQVIEQLNKIASDGLVSDLTLWLDVDVELGLKRAKNRGIPDRIEQADLEFHRRVAKGYQALALRNKKTVTIDAGGTPDEVFSEIKGVLEGFLMEWNFDHQDQEVVLRDKF